MTGDGRRVTLRSWTVEPRGSQPDPSTGLRAQDHVALLMDNSPDFLAVAWGAQRSGLYWTPVNWHLTERGRYVVDDCGARMLFASAHTATWPHASPHDVRSCRPPSRQDRVEADCRRLGFATVDPELHPPRAETEGVYFLYSRGLPRAEGNQPHTRSRLRDRAGIDHTMASTFGFSQDRFISASSAVPAAPIVGRSAPNDTAARSCSWSASIRWSVCVRSSVIASPRAVRPHALRRCSSSPRINVQRSTSPAWRSSYTQRPVSDRGQAGDDRLARAKGAGVLRWQRGVRHDHDHPSNGRRIAGRSVARPRGAFASWARRRSACRRRSGTLLRSGRLSSTTMIRRNRQSVQRQRLVDARRLGHLDDEGYFTSPTGRAT